MVFILLFILNGLSTISRGRRILQENEFGKTKGQNIGIYSMQHIKTHGFTDTMELCLTDSIISIWEIRGLMIVLLHIGQIRRENQIFHLQRKLWPLLSSISLVMLS